jgi:hypothetical protein
VIETIRGLGYKIEPSPSDKKPTHHA